MKRSKRVICFDLETDCLDVHQAKIIGMAISISVNKAVYIPLSNRKYRKLALKKLKVLFSNPDIVWIGHNLRFDLNVLRSHAIIVKGTIIDTMVLDYLLFPDRKKHNLKEISKIHLNYQQIKFDDIAIDDKNSKTLEGVSIETVRDYACEDADQTLQIYQYLIKKIESNNLDKISTIDNQLVPVIAEMEYNGVFIDKKLLQKITLEIEEKKEEVLLAIQEFIEGDININSPIQLANVLFDQLSLEPIGNKGKNGHFSVSSEILEQLKHSHPLVEQIIEYRALDKVSSTFIKALKRTHSTTGRLHTSFNQAVTATGRLSSSNPNLQNIPSKTIGNKLRGCIAAPDGYQLIGADYSNVELRIMASLSKDPTMIRAYKEGIDLHRLTTSKALHIEYTDVTDYQRGTIGKKVNFGLIYGMTAHGLAKSINKDSDRKYSQEECQVFIDAYFELYQGVKQYRDELVFRADCNGYAETIFGRKRPLPHIHSENSYKREKAKRAAMNTPIQGSAADIIRVAMVNIHKRIKQEGLHSKMILQVHDELVFEVPDDEVKYMRELIRFEMENVISLPVKLEVDLQVGTTWQEVH